MKNEEKVIVVYSRPKICYKKMKKPIYLRSGIKIIDISEEGEGKPAKNLKVNEFIRQEDVVWGRKIVDPRRFTIVALLEIASPTRQIYSYSIGISVCNPIDKFNGKIGKETALEMIGGGGYIKGWAPEFEIKLIINSLKERAENDPIGFMRDVFGEPDYVKIRQEKNIKGMVKNIQNKISNELKKREDNKIQLKKIVTEMDENLYRVENDENGNLRVVMNNPKIGIHNHTIPIKGDSSVGCN